MLRPRAERNNRIGKKEAVEAAPRRTGGHFASQISPTPTNARVSNTPSAQREQNKGGVVPKLFPNSEFHPGTLEHATQAFAQALRSDFAEEATRDPSAFKQRVVQLIRRSLPPRRGRPVHPKTEAAFALRQQGKTVRQILRLQIQNFDQLDTWGRMLAEKGLRQKLTRRERQRPGISEAMVPEE